MAKEFYWKGADTLEENEEGVGDGFSSRTYWNNKNNWFIKEFIDKSTSSTSTTGDAYGFVTADRIPAGGDSVYFTKLGSDSSLGLGGGPWPKSPCLFGGRAVTGGVRQWIGASGGTTEKISNCEKIVVDSLYSEEFSDPNSLTSIKGWQFGDNKEETAATLDGVGWDGLYLSATNMYTNCIFWGCFLKEFDGGDFYRFGSSKLVILAGTADNFTYSQDDGYLYQGDIPPYSRLSQTWVFCDVIDTIRVDADELFAGWFTHSTKIKSKKLIFSPKRCGLNFIGIYGDIEDVEIYPWASYDYDTPSVSFESKVRLYPKLDSNNLAPTNSVTYDSIFMDDKNKYDNQIEFDGTNQDVELSGSTTVTEISTKSGNFRIGDLKSDDFVDIQTGTIGYNTNMFLYSSNSQTQIKLGEDGTSIETNAIDIVSDDRTGTAGIRAPKFYFAPGTYAKSITQSPTDTLSSKYGVSNISFERSTGGGKFS